MDQSRQQAKLLSDLKDLHLTEAQARLYLCLVANDGLRIKELVSLTAIPRSSIYEHIRGLISLGLIEEVVVDTYKILKAAPIGILRHNLSEQMQSLKYQREVVSEIEDRLAQWRQTTPPHFTTVRYYRGIAGARQLFWNTLKSRNTIYVYSEWGRSKFVGTDFYQRFVAESRNRGFKEKVITNPRPETIASIKSDLNGPSARTKLKNIRFVDDSIGIKGETFIYDNVYAQIYLKGGVIDGFEIESQRFVDTQRAIFKTLYASGQIFKF